MNYRYKHYLIPIGAVITIVTLLILIILLKPQTKIAKTTERAWKVTTITLQPGNYQPQVILHGKTESPNYTILEAAVNADVIATPVYEGELVNQNDIVLQLDDQEAQLLLQQRQADVVELEALIAADKQRHISNQETLTIEQDLLQLSQKALEREQQLQKKDFGTDVAIDAAETAINQQEIAITLLEFSIEEYQHRLAQLNAQLKRAQALATQAALDLSRTTLRAPFNARIAKLNVAVGNRAQQSESLIELYDIGHIEIRASIPSHYLSVIKNTLSQHNVLTGTAVIDEQPFAVELDRLASLVNPRRGGVDGLFTITEPATHLTLARPVTILFNLPTQENSYKVPNTAVYGDRRVYAINNQQRLVAIPIQVVGHIYAPDTAQSATLIEGTKLHPEMIIITNQLPNVRNNLFVEPVDE